MLNTAKLKGKMVEKGVTVSSISSDLNISPSTFYRKMKKNSFEIREADSMIIILSLSKEDAISIFFN